MEKMPGTGRDRFSPLYGLWSAGCLVVLIASHEIELVYGPVGFLIALLAVLSAGIVLIWLAIALVRHLVGRRWRRVASILIGPPIALGVLLISDRAGFDPTWMRFVVKRSEYLQDLSLLPSEPPRMKAWSWGVTGLVVSASSEYTIVFDESDEIALPPEQRSAAWRLRADRERISSLLQEKYLHNIRKLDNHFYLVVLWFP